MLLSETIDFTSAGANNPRVAKNLVYRGRLTDLGQLLAGLNAAVEKAGGPVTLQTATEAAPWQQNVNASDYNSPYGIGRGQMRKIRNGISNVTSLMNNLIKSGYAVLEDFTTKRGGSLFNITEEGVASLQNAIETTGAAEGIENDVLQYPHKTFRYQNDIEK